MQHKKIHGSRGGLWQNNLQGKCLPLNMLQHIVETCSTTGRNYYKLEILSYSAWGSVLLIQHSVVLRETRNKTKCANGNDMEGFYKFWRSLFLLLLIQYCLYCRSLEFRATRQCTALRVWCFNPWGIWIKKKLFGLQRNTSIRYKQVE